VILALDRFPYRDRLLKALQRQMRFAILIIKGSQIVQSGSNWDAILAMVDFLQVQGLLVNLEGHVESLSLSMNLTDQIHC
jgi:hypothetical protein